MRMTEYENKIKELMSSDINNPEIYIHLQKLTEILLRKKKACRCNRDYKDISYTIAGDLVMNMINNNLRIHNIIGYLNKVYHTYINSYYKELSSYVELDYEIDSELSSLSSQEYNPEYYCINKVYLEDIIKVIDEVMNNSCKYTKTSSAFINLKLSLILSLLKGVPTPFHISLEQEFYLKLILTNFRNTVTNDGIQGIILKEGDSKYE